jgi:hypothetical protein
MCRALREFIDEWRAQDPKHRKDGDAAKAIGTSGACLSRILDGAYQGRVSTAYGIENFTGGRVTLWHMMHPDKPLTAPDPRPAQRRRKGG